MRVVLGLDDGSKVGNGGGTAVIEQRMGGERWAVRIGKIALAG
jgi:hypothetical protein